MHIERCFLVRAERAVPRADWCQIWLLTMGGSHCADLRAASWAQRAVGWAAWCLIWLLIMRSCSLSCRRHLSSQTLQVGRIDSDNTLHPML